MVFRFCCALVLFLSIGVPSAATAETRLPIETLSVPHGYDLSVYAKIPRARSLVAAPELNAVFVGSRGSVIRAIVDSDQDGTAEHVVTVRSGLKGANGVAWRAPYLYVGEQHQVVRFKGSSLEELADAKPELLFAALPDDPWHGWRYLAFGPDAFLYVALGAPCNICETIGLEGTIIRMNPDGDGAPEIYAEGVRNSVGMAFHPVTGQLFFTDNGADNMGDDIPPDEFNAVPGPGHHFGFPYYGGGDNRTRQFRDAPLPPKLVMPAARFGAHVASLGFDFHKGDAIVAHHGSWNRTVPDGYRLARVPFGPDNKPIGTWEPFIEGWLNKDSGEAWGRPVDVLSLSDKVLLISDDKAGAVYRLSAK